MNLAQQEDDRPKSAGMARNSRRKKDSPIPVFIRQNLLGDDDSVDSNKDGVRYGLIETAINGDPNEKFSGSFIIDSDLGGEDGNG